MLSLSLTLVLLNAPTVSGKIESTAPSTGDVPAGFLNSKTFAQTYIDAVKLAKQKADCKAHRGIWNGKTCKIPPKPRKPATPPKLQPNIVNSGGLPAILLRIRACESGNDYTAQNPRSTASGAFQIIDGTWAGYGGYSKAKYAPPNIQDQKALLIFNAQGTQPWISSSSCWS